MKKRRLFGTYDILREKRSNASENAISALKDPFLSKRLFVEKLVEAFSGPALADYETKSIPARDLSGVEARDLKGLNNVPDAVLRKLILTGAKLPRLTNKNLNGVSLAGAICAGFDGCDLKNADLSYAFVATMKNVDARGAKMFGMKSVAVRNVAFQGATASAAEVDGGDYNFDRAEIAGIVEKVCGFVSREGATENAMPLCPKQAPPLTVCRIRRLEAA